MEKLRQQLVIRTGRPYKVFYRDPNNAPKNIVGELLSPNDGGFVVLDVNGKQVAIPVDKIDIMYEQGEEVAASRASIQIPSAVKSCRMKSNMKRVLASIFACGNFRSYKYHFDFNDNYCLSLNPEAQEGRTDCLYNPH